mgnify:CR=1 FL=1
MTFCNKAILNCNLNPEEKSLPLIFRTVRSIELKINKNECQISLKLILIFLENDEITSLQSTFYNFKKYKKNVDEARENYLKNNNIFIKLFCISYCATGFPYFSCL